MPRAPALLPVAHSNIFLLVTDDAPSATLHSVGVFSFTPLTSLTLSRWIPPPLSLGLTICPTSQMGALLLVWMSHSLTVCLSLCVPHSVRRTLFLAFSASLTLSVCLSVCLSPCASNASHSVSLRWVRWMGIFRASKPNWCTDGDLQEHDG